MGVSENKVKDESEHKSAAGQKIRTKMRTKKRASIRVLQRRRREQRRVQRRERELGRKIRVKRGRMRRWRW